MRELHPAALGKGPQDDRCGPVIRAEHVAGLTTTSSEHWGKDRRMTGVAQQSGGTRGWINDYIQRALGKGPQDDCCGPVIRAEHVAGLTF